MYGVDEEIEEAVAAATVTKSPMFTVGSPLPLLDAEGVAALLGISKRTVEKWVGERRIPFVKLGGDETTGRADTQQRTRAGLVRFRPESLDAWIKSKEVPPDAKE